mgnify:CR=1 FL=1
MALNPTELFDIRSLLSEEERMIQDAVARFTDEKIIPIIGDAFDQVAGFFPTGPHHTMPNGFSPSIV